jgi:hypothetical protein
VKALSAWLSATALLFPGCGKKDEGGTAGARPLVAEFDERRYEELALRRGDTVFPSARRVWVFERHGEASPP